MSNIAFIGLGHMGLPMAQNLLQAGHTLAVYNRSIDKAEPLVAKGARLAKSPADAVGDAEFLFSSLSDDRALWEVSLGHEGFVDALAPGAVHVSTSTILPSTARELAAAHEEAGAHYVAAPVFGRPDAAAAGKLWICLSGVHQARQKVTPLLSAISQGYQEFGEDPGAANVVKLSGNFMIAAAIESMAEAFTLAGKNGIDAPSMAEFFGKTLFSCPIYQNYGRLIATQTFEPAGFKLSLGLKDMRLVDEVARNSMTPMPLGHLVLQRMTAGVAKQRGHWDWTGIAQEVAECAGVVD